LLLSMGKQHFHCRGSGDAIGPIFLTDHFIDDESESARSPWAEPADTCRETFPGRCSSAVYPVC
jgi:hypothetical protein